MSNLIYLDHAAATPLDDKVLKAMQPYLIDEYYNPSATYAPARQVHQALEAARGQVAHWLGSRPSEVIFTAGGTEANNLAIRGVMQRFPKAKVIVSAIEHDSVLEPAHVYNCQEASVQTDGRLDLINLKKQIDDKTVLVSVGYANNEIGTIQPLRQLAQLINEIRQDRLHRKIKLPLYFHTDACQAGNYLDLHVARLGVDLMTLNGGKLYGPKQSGALYVKAGVELAPLIIGGGQERGLRSGTENVANAIGFVQALDIAQAMRYDEATRLQELQEQFIKGLSKLPNTSVNGSLKYRLPNNVHVTFSGNDNERLLIQLEEKGVLAAAGSACSASNTEPSHVLRAIGLSDIDAQASLRFTMGRKNDNQAITSSLSAIKSII